MYNLWIPKCWIWIIRYASRPDRNLLANLKQIETLKVHKGYNILVKIEHPFWDWSKFIFIFDLNPKWIFKVFLLYLFSILIVYWDYVTHFQSGSFEQIHSTFVFGLVDKNKWIDQPWLNLVCAPFPRYSLTAISTQSRAVSKSV